MVQFFAVAGPVQNLWFAHMNVVGLDLTWICRYVGDEESRSIRITR